MKIRVVLRACAVRHLRLKGRKLSDKFGQKQAALEPGLFGQVFGRASYSTENSEEPTQCL